MSIIEKVLDKLDGDENAPGREKKRAGKSKSSDPASQEPGSPAKLDTANPGVVELDFEKLKNTGILTPDTINIKLAEQFRRRKLPILANAFRDAKLETEARNLLMVTSSLQDEGKSFTSFNLAISIAKEFNNTVLYIDADLTQRMLEKKEPRGASIGR